MSATDTQVGGSHYKSLAIQPVEFITKNHLGYCEGNAIKYLVRHRSKGGRAVLEKARHYIDLLLEMEYPERTGGVPSPSPMPKNADRERLR